MSALPEFNTTIIDEIKVMPAAHEKLVELLNSEEEINGVRIFVSGGGCGGMTYGMTFSEAPLAHDSILEQDGLTLYVDAIALSFLSGVEIDFVQQGMGASFVFKNAFAATGGSGTCGACGSAGGGCA
ncbi:MAG: iron-sulfur cluster assembly accessory protein [Gammaproteobacteria bacterium]|jgi:iron-sulfur cluster insertion protein|nr:iron-sulfur cluster assembly accessory protein [Gammaproteobacteria bacterium]